MESPYINVDGMSSSSSQSFRSDSSPINSASYHEYHSPSPFNDYGLYQEIKQESNYELDSDQHYITLSYSDKFHPTSFLPLEPCRPGGDSPLQYHNMYPPSYYEPNVQPVLLSEKREGDSPDHVEDYKCLSSITPTLFSLIKEEHNDVHPGRSGSISSGSSSSSERTSGSWNSPDEIQNANGISPSSHLSDLDIKECLRCGSTLNNEDCCIDDSTGLYLCLRCRVEIQSSVECPKMKQKSPKAQKRTSSKKNSNPICSNCSTHHTALWRRSHNGDIVCNACGLYYKLHKCNRPLTMRKDTIQKRKRKPKTPENRTLRQNVCAHPNQSSPPPYNAHLMSTSIGNAVQDHCASPHQPLILPSVHSHDGFLGTLSAPPLQNQSAYPIQYSSPNREYLGY